ICVRVHITYYVVISHHHSRYPRVDMRRTVHRMYSLFFFKQKTAYEMIWWLEFRRVLFRSDAALQLRPEPLRNRNQYLSTSRLSPHLNNRIGLSGLPPRWATAESAACIANGVFSNILE